LPASGQILPLRGWVGHRAIAGCRVGLRASSLATALDFYSFVRLVYTKGYGMSTLERVEQSLSKVAVSEDHSPHPPPQPQPLSLGVGRSEKQKGKVETPQNPSGEDPCTLLSGFVLPLGMVRPPSENQWNGWRAFPV
jgi:hypothetical protein